MAAIRNRKVESDPNFGAGENSSLTLVSGRLVLASNNEGKLREFRRLLAPLGFDVVAQAELGIPEAEEPHATFVENALAKARHASAHAGLPALADDSGVCVAALGGAPGVASARYAGEPKSDARNNAKLVAALQGVADRRAHYACVLVLVRHAADPEPIIAEARPHRRRAARQRRLRLRPALRGPGDRPLRCRAAARAQERAVAPRQGDARADRAAAGAMSAPRFDALPPLTVYVHLPWCVRKCPYCDFNSHEARGEVPQEAYVDALLADLEQSLPAVWGRRVHAAFIGGGTPSLFAPASIDRLLAGLRARLPFVAGAEVTMEANPGTFEQERFAGFRAAGVNRLSLGVQSFDDAKLAALGRIHGADDARRAAEAAMKLFDSVNLDLMFALPGQTLQECERDVDEALALGAPHLSFYQLTLEPNTLFHAQPPAGLPDADAAADMQDLVAARLAAAGRARYEVSAYAKPGEQCAHNLNYWRFGDYVGLGAGAHGKVSQAGSIVREVR